MFKEGKTKLTLLSLLLPLLVASTAFAGISSYGQTDASELTTFEEEAIAAGAMSNDNSTSDDVANETSIASTDCIVMNGGGNELSTGNFTAGGDNETATSSATGAAGGNETTGNTTIGNMTPGNEITMTYPQLITGGNETGGGNLTVPARTDNATYIYNETSAANLTSKESLDLSNTTSTAAGEIKVTLIPVEQSVGGTVLVNACGLAESSNTTVTAGNLIAGFPESDEDGNLLYALGTSDEMSGSVTVTVEDGDGNVGSASFTIIESQEEEQQPEPENATSTINATNTSSNQESVDSSYNVQ